MASIGAYRDDDFQLLAPVYKQLNATLGRFGQETRRVSTKALASGDAGADSEYERLENQLSALTTQRDSIANEIRTALDGAEFKGQCLNPWETMRLVLLAEEVLLKVRFLAAER